MSLAAANFLARGGLLARRLSPRVVGGPLVSSSAPLSKVFFIGQDRIEAPCYQGLRGMKVYTKTGDKGTSQLFNGERRNKDDDVFEALGAVDECNAFIGLACEFVDAENSKIADQLGEIMSRMFDVGASVATPQDKSSQAKIKRSSFADVHVVALENAIDAMDAELPPLRNFILPSGGHCSAHLHVARTLARRAERRVVPLVRSGQVDPEVGKFLNRLSDYLFVTARYMAMKQGHTERQWQKYVAPEAEKQE
mmetsp:Transcript_4502/g.9624  ORF Transcript_4502/g.9624 Transcript_4502/m.9624 type:complete len:252 (+) Transcript_4502:441-1196(+)